jgi:hypothetical protein
MSKMQVFENKIAKICKKGFTNEGVCAIIKQILDRKLAKWRSSILQYKENFNHEQSL